MYWPINKKEFLKIIESENSIKEFLINVRWANGLICENSGCEGELFRTKKGFRCKKCKRDYSITSNTLFHRQKLKLSELVCIMWWVSLQRHSINIKKCSEKFNLHYPVIQALINKLRGIMWDNPKKIRTYSVVVICLLESQLFISPQKTFLKKFLLAYTNEQPVRLFIQDIPELNYSIIKRFLQKIGKDVNLICSREIYDIMPQMFRFLNKPSDKIDLLDLNSITRSFNNWFKYNYGRNNRTENIGLILNEFAFFYNRRSMPYYEIFKELIKRSLNTNSK